MLTKIEALRAQLNELLEKAESSAELEKAKVEFLGKPVDTDLAFLYDDGLSRICCAVPLVAMLEAYGCEVQWLSEFRAKIYCSEKSYTLNLETKTLQDDSNPGSDLLISIFGGGVRYREAVERDFLVDDDTFRVTLDQMGYATISEYDAENDIFRFIENKAYTEKHNKN